MMPANGIPTLLLLSLSFSLFSGPCRAEDQDYGHPVDFRLSENAGRLQLPRERLFKARVALREATEAMDVITSRGGASLGPLVCEWKRLDPDGTRAALVYLYEKTRQEALFANRTFAYEWSTLQAVLLLTELAAIDPNCVIRLGQEWPAPSSAHGPNAQVTYRRFWDMVVSRRVGEIAKRDAREAAAIVSQIDSQFTYSARGQVMASLFRKGRDRQARALARDIISDYRQGKLDHRLFLDFVSFTRQLMPLSDDLFVEAWMLGLAKHPSELPSRTVPSKDGGPVVFTGPESVLLGQLDYYPKRKHVLDSLEAAFPDLHARLEAIGGLGVLVSHMRMSYQAISCPSRSTLKHVLPVSGDQAMELLRAEAIRPGGLSQLVELAGSQPAAPLTPAAQVLLPEQLLRADLPVQERCLAAVCYLRKMCTRTVLPEHRQALRLLLSEIRKSNEPNTLGDDLNYTDALRLELELLGLAAEHDFEDMLQRVESVANPRYRYQALFQIVQRLSSRN